MKKQELKELKQELNMNGNPKIFIDYFQKIYGLYQNVEYN